MYCQIAVNSYLIGRGEFFTLTKAEKERNAAHD